MEISHRRLPHWRPENSVLFTTWCLYGALPECRYPPAHHPSAGAAFVWMDRYLDTTRIGPMWLRQPEVAEVVAAEIRGATEHELGAWVVMSNHVHMLSRPLIEAGQLMRRIKGRTARQANLLLERTGQPFWQADTYDHRVRNPEEFAKIVRYIENNPVVAGFATSPEKYRWSSAWEGRAGFSLQRRL